MAEPSRPGFVVTSQLVIAEHGADALERAFQGRLGEVDGWPGFQRLEVWRDTARPGEYQMVSWWDSQADFTAYMRSASHARSHDRIPGDPRPQPAGVRRWELVAE